MSLSCYCEEGDGSGWWYYNPKEDDFTTLEKRGYKRRKRCASCNNLIELNSDTLEFQRAREPLSEVEENIYGYEVNLSSLFMCEHCGEIFLSLQDLGYCLNLGYQSMQEYLEEYWELSGFSKKDSNAIT